MQIKPYNSTIIRPFFEALAPHANDDPPSPFAYYMPTPGNSKVWNVAHLVRTDCKQKIRAAYPLWIDLTREQAKQLVEALSLVEFEFLSPWYGWSIPVLQEQLTLLGELASGFPFLQSSMRYAGTPVQYLGLDWIAWNVYQHTVKETYDINRLIWVPQPKTFEHLCLYGQGRQTSPLLSEVRINA